RRGGLGDGTMKAAGITDSSGLDALANVDVPRPEPGDGEVLVRVHAAAITPTEVTWSSTWKTGAGVYRPFPIMSSHEFSGTVAALGHGVTEVALGDVVYGFNHWDQQGAQADYCLARPARPAQLAPKPQSLDFVQAAEVPISALTAWQALFEHGHVTAGQRVLIHGATGGVGAFAVQLAHGKGAHVIATASTSNLDFARQLGADEIVDYTTTRFDAVVRDVDMVLDTVGGETLAQSLNALKPGGVLVAIADEPSQEQAEARGVRAVFFVVEPRQQELVEIGQMIDAGQLRPLVAAVYPLAQVREAYARARAGRMRGKVVLQVVD
ncbi:MAG TPA: NADP-dependent oxidoreductase, partial [Ktedonobacterales bacterium]|nr:NADP-dependent oxidoreductase [Ktedonobacterales bacterium]